MQVRETNFKSQSSRYYVVRRKEKVADAFIRERLMESQTRK